MTRRDKCWLVGRRAKKINQAIVAAQAWATLAEKIEDMGDMDMPKFNDLLNAVRQSHLHAVKLANKVGVKILVDTSPVQD